ncbi:S1C family serine protease [Fredinandcohnia onubensis]|uniref:S1C family serine protease n=1 Tax=Fredinandcohnia onubensis TaxID=1571209 RepID=UPI0015D4E4F8|nr:trypsin-like peptidase domain-containing protein [Fredinandcohnia onubensis]
MENDKRFDEFKHTDDQSNNLDNKESYTAESQSEQENVDLKSEVEHRDIEPTLSEPTETLQNSEVIEATSQQTAVTEESTLRASRPKEKKSNSKVKSFLSMLSAGVLGSALTLGVAPHIDGLQGYFNSESPATEQNSEVIEASGPVKIQPTTVNDSASSVADMVEEASKGIVGITSMQSQQNPFNRSSSQSVESGTGSGVIFQKDGDKAYIVTNNHVIENANEVEISLHNGEKTMAKLIGTDPLTDLAVLEIDSKHVEAVLPFGDSGTLRPGDQVFAIGNPLGLDLSRTVTSGIVSAKDRSISVDTSAGSWELNVIQTDAAINPGNSGGALLNTQGQVIGINSLKIANSGVEGLGFAIPSNDVVPIINSLIENGKIERPFIGIGLADLAEVPRMYYADLPNDVKEGVIVTSVAQNSAAEKAGLKMTDVIVKINDTEVKSSMDLRKYLYSKVKIGDQIELTFYRGGNLETASLTLTSNTTGIE